MWNVVKQNDMDETKTVFQTVADEQNAHDLAAAYNEHSLPYYLIRCKYVVEAANEE